jgi:stage II sporulation protein D
MKQHFLFAGILFLLLLLLPIIATGAAPFRADKDSTQTTAATRTTVAAKPNQKTEQSNALGAMPETLTVYRTGTGDTEKIPTEEYLVGSLAAEMNAGYNLEALKAQAVACATFAIYRTQEQGKAAITDSGVGDQAYISDDQRKTKWGSSYDSYEAKLEEAVDAVYGQIITYENKPILAAFHSSNAGLTESAKIVWNDDLPYLQSVSSPGDKLSPDYKTTTTFTPGEIKTAFDKISGVDFSGKQNGWFGAAKQTEAGTVTSVQVGGKELTGQQVRDALGLRSSDFTVGYADGSFKFSVLGFGHMVGMSQYGADFMARQGNDYKTILTHYYPDTDLSMWTA